jgi:hypothetical protein
LASFMRVLLVVGIDETIKTYSTGGALS